jgi:transposase
MTVFQMPARQQKRAIALREEGMSYDRIGEAVGWSSGTIKRLIESEAPHLAANAQREHAKAEAAAEAKRSRERSREQARVCWELDRLWSLHHDLPLRALLERLDGGEVPGDDSELLRLLVKANNGRKSL